MHDGLDRLRRAGMFVGKVEYNFQDKGTCVLLQGQPLVGEHYTQLAVHADSVVVVIHELFRLLRHADGNGLVRMDVIGVGWARHLQIFT